MSKKEEKTPSPIGFTANNNKAPLITFQQFFDLMRAVDAINNVVNFVKQENFNADNIRYYFPEDLVDQVDEQGNVLYSEGKDGKLVPNRVLRSDFWTGVTVVEK